MSFARISPTPSTVSSSPSVAASKLLESTELVDDPLHYELGQSWDAAQDADSARRDGVVEGIQFAVVAEQLGQPTEVQKVLMGQAH